MSEIRDPSTGPFRAYQIAPGDRYELHNGHPQYCCPTGGKTAIGAVSGALAIATDPKAMDTAADAGFSPDEEVLWAPDIAVGGITDAAGWVKGGAWASR